MLELAGLTRFPEVLFARKKSVSYCSVHPLSESQNLLLVFAAQNCED